MSYITSTDVLKVAAYRISEARHYFSNQANECMDSNCQEFLYLCAEKKRIQKKVLQNIIINCNLEYSQYRFTNFSDYSYIFKYPLLLSVLSLKQIYTFVYQHGVEEMEFYLSIVALTEDIDVRHIINTLIEMSRNFEHDVRAGYIEICRRERVFSPVYLE